MAAFGPHDRKDHTTGSYDRMVYRTDHHSLPTSVLHVREAHLTSLDRVASILLNSFRANMDRIIRCGAFSDMYGRYEEVIL